MSQLPAAQAEIVCTAPQRGRLPDELQYTRKSWLMPVLQHYAGSIAPMVGRYPKDLGFYAFDWSRGTLVGGLDAAAFAHSMRNFSNYGDGSCALLDMSRAGYVCKGWVGKGGLGGGGGSAGKSGGAAGGLPGTPQSSSAAGLACMVDAAKATGGRGQLGCAARAVAGMTFDPRTTTPQSLLSGGIAGGQPAIRDPRCALSEDAGNTGAQQDEAAKGKEPSAWDQITAAAKAVGNYVKDVVFAAFDKTPPGVAELGKLASPEGADFGRGILQIDQTNKARESLLSGNDDQIGYEYEKQRDGRVVTDPQANQRTADRPMPGGVKGGGGSAAADRTPRGAPTLLTTALRRYQAAEPRPAQPGHRAGGSGAGPDAADRGARVHAPGRRHAARQHGRPQVLDDLLRARRLSCPATRAAAVASPPPSARPRRASRPASPHCAEPPCGTLVPGGGGTAPSGGGGIAPGTPKGGIGGGLPLGGPKGPLPTGTGTGLGPKGIPRP